MFTALAKELDKYEKKLSMLDARADGLAENKKKEYEAEKERFNKRLEIWRQTMKSDLRSLKDNLEDGYYQLESKLM